jgi:hypothetical protein
MGTINGRETAKTFPRSRVPGGNADARERSNALIMSINLRSRSRTFPDDREREKTQVNRHIPGFPESLP